MWQFAFCWLAVTPTQHFHLHQQHDDGAYPAFVHYQISKHHKHSPLPNKLPVLDHPYVDRYIQYFQKQGRLHFAKWLTRSGRYEPRMRSVLRQKGLPEDLVYVALIESGFAAHAVSSAKATGFWQIMPGTAQMLGLRRNAWLDERRDFVRATEAAADYLHQLYQRFQDWHLALAAYNAGFGRIERAMQRYKAKTLYELLAHDKAIPQETRHYVPKLMAAMRIAKAPATYGFLDLAPESPVDYSSLKVATHIDLAQVAQHCAIPLPMLRQLNPGLIQDQIVPQLRHALRVPKEHEAQVHHMLTHQPEQLAPKYTHHIVRKGDTLSQIARRYGISLQVLKDHNPSQGKWLKVHHKLRIPGSWAMRALG